MIGMVSVSHSAAAQGGEDQVLVALADGLGAQEAQRLQAASAFAREVYGEATLATGEAIFSHALNASLIVAGLKLDGEARAAALLYAVPWYGEGAVATIDERFGASLAKLVAGIGRLHRLRPVGRIAPDTAPGADASASREVRAQSEILRKMLLAMVDDIRIVLLLLASRTQTLRYLAAHPSDMRMRIARDTLDLDAPLANRLGVWELKWELEDLSFRFLHPDLYKQIAGLLDERRIEREQFIADAIARLQAELRTAGIADAEVYGRPKHIYSIWHKMQKKGVPFSDVHDVRALRVIVHDIKACYTVLGIVHTMWTPIPGEFDDYVSNPKDNYYRSLHTAVRCDDGRGLEVQIRTQEMHRHAELGIAAHWRYKEGAQHTTSDTYDEKIAWLRQLLTWRDEVADSAEWVQHYKQAALDDTLYVMTPQGRVIDLPAGSTPVDFAYRVHTTLGHRCRGAKVNGQLVPLQTPLQTGQRVEIITAKQGGPSRDWLNPASGYLQTKGARSKVRQWFANLALEESLAEGRAVITRELQRAGRTGLNIDDLAEALSYSKANDLYIAAARGELNLRHLQATLKNEGETASETTPDEVQARPSRQTGTHPGIHIIGVDNLLTQLAGCCKPAPPDAIRGFVTRGRGVSIHRKDCPSFAHLATEHPERIVETAWGGGAAGVFAADIVIEAHDRQGLLRDISDVFTREKINVAAVSTQARRGQARLSFTLDVSGLPHLQRALAIIHDVPGVVAAPRV